MPGITDVRHLGDYIREQRATSQISVRQLAKLAGVSNPYLSQIERGLRKPSAEILQQLAKALRISSEAMYVQAGILEHREASPVADAVLADAGLTDRQKQVLLEIHDSFRKENAGKPPAAEPDAPERVASPRVPAKKAAARKAPATKRAVPTTAKPTKRNPRTPTRKALP